MSYQLFLDDERNPLDVKWVIIPLGPWVIVRNYKDFVKTITTQGLPTFISFDHDLADEQVHDYMVQGRFSGKLNYDSYKEKTGMDCAKWLVEYCLDKKLTLPNYVVHSMNSVGVTNITALLKRFKQFQKESS